MTEVEDAMRRGRSCAAFDAVALLWAALVTAFIAWRVMLPNNAHRDLDIDPAPEPGEMLAQTSNGYDDVVTIVTAHNFATEGFRPTHLLPNRRGAPLVSYFDFSHTQCESRAASGRTLTYPSFWGEPVEMLSLNRDCIYTHYPPLADWFFGGLAAMGLSRVVHYKLAAALLNGILLFLLYRWLRREVRPAAALAAVGVTGAAPAFLEWGSALYYQPFQYLFLVAGILCWSRFLERPARSWFWATWGLFCCEALVSYELVLFFGLAVAALTLLASGTAGAAQRVRWVAAQATAPLAATALHFGLRVSLFGISRTWENARVTAVTRVREGFEPWRVELWFNRVHYKLLPLGWMVLVVVLVVAVRWAAGKGVRRPVLLLAAMLAGALSFAAVFPGMAVMHTWMMYRHLLPFFALVVAYAAETVLGAVRAAPKGVRGWRPGLVVCGGLLCALPLGWAAWRSVRAIRTDVAWTVDANRHVDPGDLAPRFLDALYWRETGPQVYGVHMLTPLDGHRTNGPGHPSPMFTVEPGAVAHYEIWWLQDVALRRVSFLTDAPSAEALRGSCALSAFDGEGFRRAPVEPRAWLDPFQPAAGEAPQESVWVRYALPVSTRAVRLTCDGSSAIPLHHVEALGEDRP